MTSSQHFRYKSRKFALYCGGPIIGLGALRCGAHSFVRSVEGPVDALGQDKDNHNVLSSASPGKEKGRALTFLGRGSDSVTADDGLSHTIAETDKRTRMNVDNGREHPPNTLFEFQPLRDLNEIETLLMIAKRCNIMGSVQLDYQSIRKWHQDRGYLGGIVVRELDETLEKYKAPAGLYDKVSGETEAARRECYYLYYEMNGRTGKRTYDVFIRGTMTWSDMIHNLKWKKVHL